MFGLFVLPHKKGKLECQKKEKELISSRKKGEKIDLYWCCVK